MSRWSIFWYFTGNFWSKRRKSRWRSVRRPYWISDKTLSGFRILVQRSSNTPKIIKIGQPCLWTNLQILHGFLVDTLLSSIPPKIQTNVQRGWYMVCFRNWPNFPHLVTFGPWMQNQSFSSKVQLVTMAMASDKFYKNGRVGATKFQILSPFWTSSIHNRVRELKQNFACLILGLSVLWWYMASTPCFYL